MSIVIRSALAALALVAGVAAASAQPVHRGYNAQHEYSSTDTTPLSFWEQQQRNGS